MFQGTNAISTLTLFLHLKTETACSSERAGPTYVTIYCLNPEDYYLIKRTFSYRRNWTMWQKNKPLCLFANSTSPSREHELFTCTPAPKLLNPPLNSYSSATFHSCRLRATRKLRRQRTGPALLKPSDRNGQEPGD